MTRAELRTRLKLYHENTTYYTDIDFNDSIQDGYDEVVALTGCILKAAVIPYVPSLTYYDMRVLIPDYVGVIAIFNPNNKRWLCPTSILKLEQVEDDWETRIGTPDSFAPVSHRYVAIYRKMTVLYGDMWVYYVASAPTLTDSDPLIGIPEEYMPVENYVITDLYEQQQEWTKALGQFRDYVALNEQLTTWMQNARSIDRIKGLM